jgi:hypothetical protein
MAEHCECVLSSRLLGTSKSVAKCSDLFRDHVDRTAAACKWARTINAYTASVAVGVSVCLYSK